MTSTTDSSVGVEPASLARDSLALKTPATVCPSALGILHGQRPIFDRESGNLLEISEIPADQYRVAGEGNARDSEIQRAQAPTARTKRRKTGLSCLVEYEDIHPHESAFLL